MFTRVFVRTPVLHIYPKRCDAIPSGVASHRSRGYAADVCCPSGRAHIYGYIPFPTEFFLTFGKQRLPPETEYSSGNVIGQAKRRRNLRKTKKTVTYG